MKTKAAFESNATIRNVIQITNNKGKKAGKLLKNIYIDHISGDLQTVENVEIVLSWVSVTVLTYWHINQLRGISLDEEFGISHGSWHFNASYRVFLI